MKKLSIKPLKKTSVSRRNAIQSVLGLEGTSLLLPLSSYAHQPAPSTEYSEVKITKLETFLVKPRWVFLKSHTDAGLVGRGEPLLEGRALTIQTTRKPMTHAIVPGTGKPKLPIDIN